MTNASTTHRLTAVLVAVVFGMSWGAPVVQAFCASAGHSMPNHCDSFPAEEHCCKRDPSPAVCGTQYVNHDLRATNIPTPEPPFVGASVDASRTAAATGPSVVTSVPLSWHAILRTVRRHAHVGVWLE